MAKIKKPLLFTLLILPAAFIGGLFTQFFMLDTQSQDVINQAVAQAGSMEILTIVTVLQTVMTGCFCGFVGYIISDKIGLIQKPFAFKKKGLAMALLFGAVTGIALGVDHFASGAIYPEIQTSNIASLSVNGVVASVFYGGIIEEVMLRLFFMSLVALIIWKVFLLVLQQVHIVQSVKQLC